jgi:hypothetical protein
MRQKPDHLVMSKKYEIFRRLPQGSHVPIITVSTIGEVEQTIHALEWVEPGDYFTREATSGAIVQGLGPTGPECPRK